MTEISNKSSARYQDLAGRTAFVSGGATGIGRDIVIALHFQGTHVVFVDIDETGAAALCAGLERQTGGRPDFIRCDVTDTDDLETALRTADAAKDGLDILVNNAANDQRQPLDDVDEPDWDACVAVNLKHQFFAARAAARLMRGRKRGSIINFGSVAPLIGVPDLSVYSLCKSAITGMSRSLARELGDHGIRVNTIIPGCILTPRQLELWISPDDERRILGEQCLHRRLIGHDVAEMALFLASDVSSACTSQEFTVDGGLT